MKLISFFLKDGHLTSRGADSLGVAGVLIIWGAAYFFDEWSGLWFWTLAILGGALGYLGAYGGLARKFGFSAPFTNDPLGWRKAKKSYKTDAMTDEEANTRDKP